MKKITLSVLMLISLSAFANGHGESHDEKHEDKHAEVKHEEKQEDESVAESFSSVLSAAKDKDIVSQPADCLAKQTIPCTFKSVSRHKASIGKTEFIFLKNAVIKITNFQSLNLEPIVGGFIVTASKSKVSAKGIPLTKFPSYADITKGQVEVVDGKDFYVYKFGEGEPERYLLDREPFIKKLSAFYNNVGALKAEYKNISPIYSKSFKQDVVLHKQILTRRIASVEEEKKAEAERLRQLRELQRRNKEIFYKRTFVQ